jgi:hypothetical protein
MFGSRKRFFSEFEVETALAGASAALSGVVNERAVGQSALKAQTHNPPIKKIFSNVYLASDIPDFDFALLVSGWSVEHGGVGDNDVVLCNAIGEGFSFEPGKIVVTKAKDLDTIDGVNGEWKCLRYVESVDNTGDVIVSSSAGPVGNRTLSRHSLDRSSIIGYGVYKFNSSQLA